MLQKFHGEQAAEWKGAYRCRSCRPGLAWVAIQATKMLRSQATTLKQPLPASKAPGSRLVGTIHENIVDVVFALC
jgi:hypothetical protein